MNEPIYNEYGKKDIIPILQTALEDGIISADKKRPTLSFQKHYRRILLIIISVEDTMKTKLKCLQLSTTFQTQKCPENIDFSK